jgi:signal recognition particle GTPase
MASTKITLETLRQSLQSLATTGQGKHLAHSTKRDVRRVIGLIHSMTPDERTDPSLLHDRNRCFRVALGAGATPDEVEELVSQCLTMAETVDRMRSISSEESDVDPPPPDVDD